jgi:hypothetical protein
MGQATTLASTPTPVPTGLAVPATTATPPSGTQEKSSQVPIRGNLVTKTLAIPVTKRARLTVERALVTRQIRGEPVGSLDTVLLATNARTLHTKLLDGAKQFVRDYAKQGFMAMTEPESFIAWGPYQCRGFGMTTTKPTVVHGYQQGEDPFPDACDFIIQGNFLSTYGRVPT